MDIVQIGPSVFATGQITTELMKDLAQAGFTDIVCHRPDAEHPQGPSSKMIDDHASHCIEDALASGDREDQRAKFTELLELLDKARG
jgi:protein tyrosine phosphatase (PTP) superfamily phosphohydrolase (DUF442 family)